MNKNISVWRGSNTPPTNYHVWIKDDNSINVYDKTEWKVTSYPELKDDLKLYTLEQIEALKDGADIDFDNLKKISDWIKEHEEDYITTLPLIETKLNEVENLASSNKDKLAGIAEGANVNVQSDWNATEGDAFIKNKPTNLSDFSDDLNIMNTLTKLSWSQTSVSTSLSSSVVYPGTLVTVTATITSAFMSTVDKIEIKYNNSVVKSVSNSNLTIYTVSLTEAKDHVFTSYITSGELSKYHSATLSVRNPVYVGVGKAVSDILVDSNKLSARKSAVSTYEKTITETGLSFYLLVPNDVTAPKEFSMGGAPVDIEQSTTTINNVTYKVFKTKGTYNKDIKLTISTK